MTVEQLQTELAKNVYSTHGLAEVREHISALKAMLYRSTDTKILQHLDTHLPEKFRFLSTLLNSASAPEQREKLLDLAEKSIASFEVVYITLPYSPTNEQLADYKKILSQTITQPFVIKAECRPEHIGELTWDFAGQRHVASALATAESPTP